VAAHRFQLPEDIGRIGNHGTWRGYMTCRLLMPPAIRVGLAAVVDGNQYGYHRRQPHLLRGGMDDENSGMAKSDGIDEKGHEPIMNSRRKIMVAAAVVAMFNLMLVIVFGDNGSGGNVTGCVKRSS
jgi:hypothetical protein